MWNGRHIRESAKTGNPRTARQIESARKTELAKGEVVIKDKLPAPTFEALNGARFGFVHNPKGKTKLAKRNLSLTARVHSLLSMRYEATGKPATGWVFRSNAIQRNTFRTQQLILSMDEQSKS
jgi:hypothetical protein